MKLGFRTGTTSPIALQHCIAELDGAHWCVACVNWVKDPLKQACYGPLGGVSSRSSLSLTLIKGSVLYAPSLRTFLRGGRRREE